MSHPAMITMLRLASVLTLLLAIQTTPATAADCVWSNGVYRCTDRSGRTFVTKPRLQPPPRRSQDAVRDRALAPRDFGTGMGAFSYGCTMSRCD